MKIDLNGKTVLVTGASRGIGKGIALEFAQAGAKVIVHYNHKKEEAQELAAQLGTPQLYVQADLSQADKAPELFEKALALTGSVDILVNNAGIFEEHQILDTDWDEWLDRWNRTLQVNLHSVAHLCFVAGKYMAARKSGKIINISSRGAFRGEPGALAYGASKSGLNSFSQSLAQALAPSGVLVYTIAPGFVGTDMALSAMVGSRADEIRNQSPLKRIAEPAEIGRLAVFLAGEHTDYLTGSIIDINGASYLRN